MKNRLVPLLALAAALLVALYAGLGFLVLPGVLKDRLVDHVGTPLGHVLKVDALRVNPFSLRVEADGVALSRKDGVPLAGFKQLQVDLEWLALLRGGLRFAEIRLTEPVVHANLDAAGRLNWADLVNALPRKAQTSEASPPRLFIERLSIGRGRILLADSSRGGRFEERIEPLDIELQELSTVENEEGKYTLKARLDDGGTLSWGGTVSLVPFHLKGALELAGVSLATPWRAALPGSTAKATGKLALKLGHELALGGAHPVLRIDDLEVTANGLALSEKDADSPAFALDSLKLGRTRIDLTKRDVKLGELQLSGLKADLSREATGALNLARLLPPPVASRAAVTAPGTAPTPSGPQAARPGWNISAPAIRIGESALRYRDAGFAQPLEAAVGTLEWSLAASAETGAALKLELSGMELALGEVTVAGARLGKAVAKGGAVSLSGRTVSLDSVQLAGLRLPAGLDEQGRLDWARAFDRPAKPAAGAASPAPDAASAPDVAPWKFSLGALRAEDGVLNLQDRRVTPAAALEVQNLLVTASALNYPSPKPADLTVSALIKQGGKLALRGRLVPEPLAVSMDVQVEDLELGLAQPYLSREVALTLSSGKASASGRLAWQAAGKPALSYEGALAIRSLRLDQEGLKEPFLSWNAVSTRDMKLSLSPGALAIGELVVSQPDGELRIAADQSNNFARLRKAAPAAAPAAEAARPAPAATDAAERFAVDIQRIRVEGARMDFEDLSLVPPFGARIHELSGVINGVSNAPNTPTRINLDGRVDEYGLARIRGEANFFSPRELTRIDASFRNLDLSRMSPYSAKFAGHRITGGRLTTELQYRIKGGQLEAENKVTINRIQLGEEVDAPGVTRLPLRLAIALLEDANGVIDLDLPIRGNLDDPQFSYGPLIWQAIGNVLSKIVTAPFRALGRLFGGDSEEDFGAVEFDPGSARVLPPEREKLAKVAKALSERPQLQLSVSGGFDPAADANTLRRIAVRNELARRMGLKVENNEDPGSLDNVNPETQRAAEGLYAERYGSPELRNLRDEVERAQAGKDAREQARAVTRAVIRRLVERTPLPDTALANLATQRAAAILAVLAEGGTPGNRVELKPPVSVERAKNGVPSALTLSAK